MDAQVLLDLLSVPFGSLALYYGYRGYVKTRGGLKAYGYFFLAMVGMGFVILLDVLRLLNLLPQSMLFLHQLFHALVAILFMLAFKDLYEFVSKMD